MQYPRYRSALEYPKYPKCTSALVYLDPLEYQSTGCPRVLGCTPTGPTGPSPVSCAATKFHVIYLILGCQQHLHRIQLQTDECFISFLCRSILWMNLEDRLLGRPLGNRIHVCATKSTCAVTRLERKGWRDNVMLRSLTKNKH